MKNNCTLIVLLIFNLLMVPNLLAQDIGATFCWHYKEIYGGHDYAANQSIANKNLPSGTHWSTTTEWWENMAEEIDYSGIDFVALLSRGNQPNAPDRGNGNPIHIPKLVNAMDVRGCDFKLAIFDDCPNSWTGSKNWDESAGALFSTDSPKFDCSNTANDKYIWDYNLKQAIEKIPDAKRYKINGRMVIFFWSAKPAWMTNLQGNLSRILQMIKNNCNQTFGFEPYLIIDKDWLDQDNTISTLHADGVHGWFSSAGGVPYTLINWNGNKYGALCPGIRTSNHSDYMDPSMGTTDNSLRIRTSLDKTVGAGAITTLVEGFTDAAENAALWRSNDLVYYDYPNQRLNALRRYSKKPFPTVLKVEVEACDVYNDLTISNSGGAFLHSGDLDVLKCSDTYGGWCVTSTQENEWMEWKELPLVVNTKFQLRYKSTASSTVKFSVDGTDLIPTILPSTNDTWTTIDAGEYNLADNGLHTVRLTIVSGSPDINYFTRVVNGSFAVTGVDISPVSASITIGEKQQLSAHILPLEASNRTLYWSSSNPEIASVNSDGLVTGIGEGTATITVRTQDGNKTDESLITVAASQSKVQTYQAEEAIYSGAIVNTNQPGFNGTGFIDFQNAEDDYIEWTIEVSKNGIYELSIRYALPVGGRPLEFSVNDIVKMSSLDFVGTGDWSVWGTLTINQQLSAGTNKIKLRTNGNNGGNIDELSVSYAEDTGLFNRSINQDKSFNLYPNPFSQGKLYLDMVGFENESMVRVTIYNLSGKIVYDKSLSNTKHVEFDLTGKLCESIYLISVKTDVSCVVKKLIVR